MLKVFEAFSGYGSQSIALDRCGIDYEVVGISEIDEVALKAYYALHTKDIKNFGDISQIKVEDLPQFDLFTYSFPCTSISLTGKIEGLERGKTSSGLLYECERIIEYCKPKYLLMENVKSLVGKRFKDKFEEWLLYLERLGYSNQWFVLNSRDFNIPQNRERVFCISILNEEFKELHIEQIGLSCCLNDYLEQDAVDKSYYKGYYPELKGVYGNGAYRGRYNEQGKTEQKLEFRYDGVCNTLTSVSKDNVIVNNGNVRYLTEREYGRLMGLKEEEIDKILSLGIGKHKLYKLFGNSIVVNVLEGIFKTMFISQ